MFVNTLHSARPRRRREAGFSIAPMRNMDFEPSKTFSHRRQSTYFPTRSTALTSVLSYYFRSVFFQDHVSPCHLLVAATCTLSLRLWTIPELRVEESTLNHFFRQSWELSTPKFRESTLLYFTILVRNEICDKLVHTFDCHVIQITSIQKVNSLLSFCHFHFLLWLHSHPFRVPGRVGNTPWVNLWSDTLC